MSICTAAPNTVVNSPQLAPDIVFYFTSFNLLALLVSACEHKCFSEAIELRSLTFNLSGLRGSVHSKFIVRRHEVAEMPDPSSYEAQKLIGNKSSWIDSKFSNIVSRSFVWDPFIGHQISTWNGNWVHVSDCDLENNHVGTIYLEFGTHREFGTQMQSLSGIYPLCVGSQRFFMVSI